MTFLLTASGTLLHMTKPDRKQSVCFSSEVQQSAQQREDVWYVPPLPYRPEAGLMQKSEVGVACSMAVRPNRFSPWKF